MTFKGKNSVLKHIQFTEVNWLLNSQHNQFRCVPWLLIVTFIFDLRMILYRDIRSPSILGAKVLN